MVEEDPLRGLEDVDWARLEHAYGTAGDVPGQLAALRSASSEQRERALWKLFSNIFHQGSRYEAAAHAVPFLVALAVDPGTPDRAEVIGLLGALAIGYDESHLPDGVDISEWRDQVTRMRTADPDEVYREFDEWVAQAANEGERGSREFRRQIFDFDAQLSRAEWELGAYDAVRASVPRLSTLLGDPDPAVRAATAWTVGWFPESADLVLPRLLELLEDEPVPGVRANAIVAAGLLGDATLVDRLRGPLARDEPLERWAAATALARLGAADAEVIGELAACSVNPPDQDEPAVHFLEGDLRGYASSSLALLDGQVPADVVASVLDGLSRTSEIASFAVAAAALRLAFGPRRPSPRPPYDDLTELQRRTVRTLADLDTKTWHWVNFTDILRAWNLPDERDECRRYAGLPA